MRPTPTDYSEVERVVPSALGPLLTRDNAFWATHAPRTGRYRPRGFTLVELLVAMTLGLIILAMVVSSYVFLGKNFTRSLGITSANQPNLESQGRRTLSYFMQDVETCTGISGTPSASSLVLTLPTSSGTTTVTYTYDSSAQTLTRTLSGGSALILHSSLVSFAFSFYDNSGNPYTTFVNYLPGIKQASFTLTTQAGKSGDGTLTELYTVASPRLLFRNKSLPP